MISGLTWANRSPASSHFELEFPNHPTVAPAFFSALAKNSSAFDFGMLLGLEGRRRAKEAFNMYLQGW